MADLNQIPGDPEIWLVDGQYYVVYVYDFKFMEGELPVSWKISSSELKTAFGDEDVKVDKRLTGAAFNKTGALNFGSYTGLATFEHDPMTEWMDNFRNESKVRPWLKDAEVASVYLGAYMEGREPTDAEFENTEWWRTHSASQREWLLLFESDPATAANVRRDNRIALGQKLRDAGVAGAGGEIVGYMNQQFTFGNWTEGYLEQQIKLLADPYAPGKLDKDFQKFLRGKDVDQTMAEEDTVAELYAEWLGPMHGTPGKKVIQQWAGRIRNDPDAQQKLEAYLAKQRMALFSAYDDPNTTYEDIAGTRRQEWEATLGSAPKEAKDKAWIQFLRMNDAEAGGEFMRQTGIARGSRTVSNDALNDTMRAFSTTRAPM